MEVHVLIVEFVLATHCILIQWQVKPELPESHQLLHGDVTFSIGTPIYAKLTIATLPFGRYVPTLRPDSFFLAIGLVVRPNHLMLSFLRLTFIVLGGQKYQHDDSLGPCLSIHLISIFSPRRHDVMRRVDGKFRGVAWIIDDFISVWMFRGGQRQISRGADSKYQCLYRTTINYNYSMGRALNNGPWYTRAASMLMKSPLYRWGK